jgi:hypothetical protein
MPRPILASRKAFWLSLAVFIIPGGVRADWSKAGGIPIPGYGRDLEHEAALPVQGLSRGVYCIKVSAEGQVAFLRITLNLD